MYSIYPCSRSFYNFIATVALYVTKVPLTGTGSELKLDIECLVPVPTYVGERGVSLSGGQIQRIGIARALYINPELLFLDEMTSSLDLETENQIMNDISSLKGEKTILIITHRKSTTKFCDEIFQIKNGKLYKI